MNPLPDPDVTRGRYEGVANVVRFNWPLYTAGGSAVAIGLALLLWPGLPRWAWVIVLAGTCGAAYLLEASLLVSHWVYDRSGILRFDWVRRYVDGSVAYVVNLHSGFDESSERLKDQFCHARFEIYDFYDPTTMTEPSIKRARKYQARQASAWLKSATRAISADALPMTEKSVDAAFLLFAAHEIRDPAGRQRLFDGLYRSLKPGGRLIVVEHLRDVANFCVFGPQFVHFHSRKTWLDHASKAGYGVVDEFRVTPFVRGFVFERRA